MATYEEQLAALAEKMEKLEEESARISDEQHDIRRQVEELERKRKESLPGLTEKQEKWLRQELTVVGKILCSEDVVFGRLELLDEEPDTTSYTTGYFGTNDPKKFSVDISVGLCIEFQAGLRCNVTVKTKTPRVEDIVREMFEQVNEYPPELVKRTWDVNWDYRQTIVLRKPYVDKEREAVKDGKL